jgi:hypothetical protein
MKIYKEIEQGSLEWHNIRYGKVGGSTSKQLHVKSDTLLNELVSCRLEPFDEDAVDGFKSAAMERGNELEPEARAALEVATGLKFEEFGWLEMDGCELMGLSPDGLTADLKIGCELKCPSRAVHVRYVREGVLPSDYVDQIIQFFAVNEKLESVWFASFRPECDVPLFKLEITKDSVVNTGTKARPVMSQVSVMAANKMVLGLQLAEEVKEEVKRVIESQF